MNLVTHKAKYSTVSLAIDVIMSLFATDSASTLLHLCLRAFTNTMKNKMNSMAAVVTHPTVLIELARKAHDPSDRASSLLPTSSSKLAGILP